MKIIFCTDQIYLHGGIEKVLSEKANYFAELLNYQVTIITTEQKNKKPQYFLSPKINQIDLQINYQRDKSYYSVVNSVKIPKHIFALIKTLKSLQPNILIVSNFAPDFYFVPFILPQIKKIKEFHSSRFFENLLRTNSNFITRLKFFVTDFIESKYDKIIVLNQDEVGFVKSNNAVVIENPLPLTEINCTAFEKRAVAAGRIAPVKGFESLISIWADVVIEAPDWQLDIYGNGDKDYIASLQNLIIAKNLQKSVFIKPAVTNLTHTMSTYSMYLMTSKTECFPMVLLESLSIGLPVISFDCPTGPRNIVTNNVDGFLIENGNCVEFSNKILYLIKNKQKRAEMGLEAKKNALRFNTTTVMKKFENLFNSLFPN